MPLNLVKIGGWSNRKVIDYYVNFAKFVLNEYKDDVTYWIPFNEINDLTTGVGNWNHGGILNEGTETFQNQKMILTNVLQHCTINLWQVLKQ